MSTLGCAVYCYGNFFAAELSLMEDYNDTFSVNNGLIYAMRRCAAKFVHKWRTWQVKRLGLTPLLMLALILYVAYLQFQYYKSKWQFRTLLESKVSERAMNESGLYAYSDHYMKILNNVCVENSQYRENQKLVIYRSGLSFDSAIGHFTVQYTRDEMPSGRTVGQVGYFIPTRFPQNFFHNTEDFLVPLFHLLNQSNAFNRSSRGILYEKEVGYQDYGKQSKKCRPPKMCNLLEPFLAKMPLKQPPYRYDFAPAPACFHQGVVSSQVIKTDTHIIRDRSEKKSIIRQGLSEYLAKAYKLAERKRGCLNRTMPKITIIQRKGKRQITNLDTVVEYMKRQGIEHIRVVHMESRTLRQQLDLIYCTDLLVGVHGAGLTWAMFLRKYTSLVEIAFPEIYRLTDFFYSKIVQSSQTLRTFQYHVERKNVLHINKARKHWYRDVDVKLDPERFTKLVLTALENIRAMWSGNNTIEPREILTGTSANPQP